MTKLADLHIHTYYSDSTSSPEEVVEQAYTGGLSCIAITDHDTVDGIAPTMIAAKKYNIEVIPGIELSSQANNKDIHILGYCFDYESSELLGHLKEIQDARYDRMKEIILKLKEFGIHNIEIEEVEALAQSKSVGRPHIAQLLYEKGWVRNHKEAFDKYLSDSAPAFVHKFKQTPQEAIALIKRFGGISVLAHPQITAVDELIPSFVRSGLDGIEVYYPNVPEALVRFYENQARKHHLIMTGGSDAHGKAKAHTYVGRMKIPYALVEGLKAQAQIK